ncbi:hypothetical protein GQ53DRAFT_746285 [Thozetella sp. PMI_491]|nr:hypothetical protein GQ53DRAFT_746285 [Thozetella sp. PMI_491]
MSSSEAAAGGPPRMALIGLGSIGISFAALFLKFSKATVAVYDPRPDLEQHIRSILPVYLDSEDAALSVESLISASRLRIATSLEDACAGATIVQEQGPENLAFKASVWEKVAKVVGADTHLWSSTSGIPASKQVADLDDSIKSRLLVVHPFNPPHIMPLIEICPSPHTKAAEVEYVVAFFKALNSGHRPVALKKEVSGFVGNRLAFVLLREACQLVADGVVDIEGLDAIVEASVGPRWAVTGPFKSYNYGGGVGGLDAWFKNLSGSVQDVWDNPGDVSFDGTRYDAKLKGTDVSGVPASWTDDIVKQTQETYGTPTTDDFAKRDRALKAVLKTVAEQASD